MRRRKRKPSGSEVVFLIFAGMLSVFFFVFAARMFWRFEDKEISYQSVVSMEGVECGGGLEEELKKIPGVCSFTPVIEIPVSLKAEDYRMDATWVGVELKILNMEVSQSQETPIGTVPALLLGETSLSVMTDRNGHMISEEKQKELLKRSGEIQWQYCLAGEEEGVENWKPCLVAGVLHSPSEEIYLDYGQAEYLTGMKETKKFLLTVKGKENYEKALEYFGGQSPSKGTNHLLPVHETGTGSRSSYR